MTLKTLDSETILKIETSAFMRDVDAALAHARLKFPGTNTTLAAMVEEMGEVAQAMMDEPRTNFRAECAQLAAMAIRLAVEGDHTIEALRESKGLDAITPKFCMPGRSEQVAQTG